MKTYKKKYLLIRNQGKHYISYNLTDSDRFMFELYAGMILDELTYTFNVKRLQELLNNAIDKKDVELFKELSLKYSQLLQSNS
jgi:uncharacterized protein YpiB (UPF0302 family)